MAEIFVARSFCGPQLPEHLRLALNVDIRRCVLTRVKRVLTKVKLADIPDFYKEGARGRKRTRCS